MFTVLQSERQKFFPDDFDWDDGFRGPAKRCISITQHVAGDIGLGRGKALWMVGDDFPPILSYDMHLLEVTGANSVRGVGFLAGRL